MGIVYPDELAQRIISVSRSCAVTGFGNDIAAVVVGVGEGNARLLEGRHQRGGAARTIAAICITVIRGHLRRRVGVLHHVAGNSVQVVIGILCPVDLLHFLHLLRGFNVVRPGLHYRSGRYA